MKSLLVHLDASPRAAVRLALAQRLANRHGAALKMLYGVVPPALANPWAAGESIMTAAASLLGDLDREQKARARSHVDEAMGGRQRDWIDGGASPYPSLLQHALYADLVVLGQHDGDDMLTGTLPEGLVPSLIADAGRPTLVVPYVGAFEALPDRVLVAWKPCREAARAVTAALPWLRLASEVHVALRPEGDTGDVEPAAALQHWLLLQGITAPVRTHGLGEVEVGEALLSLAADTGAELLVMGCYGHSRAREWVLGGASRTVLRSMTLPVLMAH